MTAQSTNGHADVVSYMTRYPPLYYAFVGVVLRAGLSAGLPGHVVLRAAELSSSLICLLFVVIGGVALMRRYGLLPAVVASLGALTPTAWFLFGTVNPNGLEIAAAFCLAALVLEGRSRMVEEMPFGRFAWVLGLTAVALAWSRPLSWIWAVLILSVLLYPLPGEAWLRAPVRRCVRLTKSRSQPAAFTGMMILLAMGWFAWASQTRAETVQGQSRGRWDALDVFARGALVILKFGDLTVQGTGVFGWADTLLPQVFVFIAVFVTGSLVLLHLIHPARELPTRAPILLVVAASVVAMGHEFLTAFGWQGRYLLPPVAASLALLTPGISKAARSIRTASVIRLLGGALVFVQIVGLLWCLGRFMYGVQSWTARFDSAPFPLGAAGWQPWGGGIAVLALGAVASSAIVAVLGLDRSMAQRQEPSRRSSQRRHDLEVDYADA